MSEEIWRDIPDWPYHQVSNHGNVRVLPGGVVMGRRVVKEIELRRIYFDDGYALVGRGNRNVPVHRLVLMAFIGPCPLGQECRHLNGNPSDNRWPENIIWGTRTENVEDMRRHGTMSKGERHPNARLTRTQVLEIQSRTESYIKLAREYGVSYQTISRIRNRQTYK